MASRRGQVDEIVWSSLTTEELGLELLKVYRRADFVTGESIEFVEDPGVFWRKLNVPGGLVTFAMNLTGLGKGHIDAAHKWMLENGFRYAEGAGRGTKHFIMVEPSAGSNSDGTAEEVDDALAAAKKEITQLRITVGLLNDEVERLLAERERSGGPSPDAHTLGLARQLRATIDSE